jgi:hypothetical protein
VTTPYIDPSVTLPEDFQANPGGQSNLDWPDSMALEIAPDDEPTEGEGLPEDQALAFLARRVRPLAANETQGVMS